MVGAGWAGLAAAVRGVEAGCSVTLFEAARHLGGRARSVEVEGRLLDNGQHILIGAYAHTLALMRRVGADPRLLLERLPLALQFPDGSGLSLPPGRAVPAFMRGVLTARGWSAADRLSLLGLALRWRLAGFRCREGLTVAELCSGARPRVLHSLIEPLCVAALNTPAAAASARVFLRVLHDALFGGVGAADLLLPRVPLGALLPDPAAAWLQAQRAELRLGQHVKTLAAARPGSASDGHDRGWCVDGRPFDAVVLALPPPAAARLVDGIDPAWSACAAAISYEPIVTVYVDAPGARLPLPMMALMEGPAAPAQFVFDHGALGASAGVFAFVVSGARAWVDQGADITGAAVLAQARTELTALGWPAHARVLRVLSEKRATFRCTPGLQRPPALIQRRLVAAGDAIAGPYPATLEGAVRSGEAAIDALLQG